VGAYRPKNLIHILIDNEVHDSTGGQGTVTGGVSFGAVAAGFGYPKIYSTDLLNNFSKMLQEISVSTEGPFFVHMKTKKGSPEKLGRPKVTPAQVSVRFSNFIQGK
jgi:phosphonopyruvate decarboxylase